MWCRLTLSRAILSALLLFFLVVTVLPGVIYFVGIYRVDGRPTPAIPENYSPEVIVEAWTQCKETSPVEVKATNPWSVAIKILTGDSLSYSAGERAAWRIASTHNAANRQGGNTWWHTSGAALTIWITREWSAEQIGATLVRDNLCT